MADAFRTIYSTASIARHRSRYPNANGAEIYSKVIYNCQWHLGLVAVGLAKGEETKRRDDTEDNGNGLSEADCAWDSRASENN